MKDDMKSLISNNTWKQIELTIEKKAFHGNLV